MSETLVSPNSELLRTLSRDFRLSFKFSQGSSQLQSHLFGLLAATCKDQFANKYAGTSAIDNWVALSKPPHHHQDSGVDEAHIEEKRLRNERSSGRHFTPPAHQSSLTNLSCMHFFLYRQCH